MVRGVEGGIVLGLPSVGGRIAIRVPEGGIGVIVHLAQMVANGLSVPEPVTIRVGVRRIGAVFGFTCDLLRRVELESIAAPLYVRVVAVPEPVAVRVLHRWIRAVSCERSHVLVIVVHFVPVAVSGERVASDLHLEAVGQSISVRVGIEGIESLLKQLYRVELHVHHSVFRNEEFESYVV